MPPDESSLSADLRRRLAALIEQSLGTSIRDVEPISPGLGHRQFLRVWLSGDAPPSVIARIDPPGRSPAPAFGVAPEPPLEPIRRLLESHGLPVPARHAADPEAGIELLEDVGQQSLEQAVFEATAEERMALYDTACALVPRLQAIEGTPSDADAFARRLDAPLFETKARKLVEWTLPVGLGRDPTPAERDAVLGAFSRIAEICSEAPARLAHRDMKAANLILRVTPKAASLVLIDLQGAFLAPPEYDLVCLLRDPHVALPEAEVRAHVDRVRPALPDVPGADDFARRFDLLTLTRVSKDISHYLHAARSRDDERYLDFVPRGVAYLMTAAERAVARDPDLGPLAELIDKLVSHFVPQAMQREPGVAKCVR
jgi:aminoglycoside/choline kinase family phosphotransferase